MGRPSGMAAKKKHLANTLRVELQRQIERGQCAYCRAPAGPDQPLTREHVIPRARGGRRKDIRIIVPACLRCNTHRGCSELVPFLLNRPSRISSFLDYLGTLSMESIRQLDPRIVAELYVAIAILGESAQRGAEWRAELGRLSSGRSLHRRRHAARRAVGAISERLGESSDAREPDGGPSCILPGKRFGDLPIHLDEPLERLASRVLSVMALLWQVSAERAERELTRELAGSAIAADPLQDGAFDLDAGDGHDVVPLDGWRARPRRRRLRVDRRQGRMARQPRGRAA